MNPIVKIRKAKMRAQKGRCFYCRLPMWDKNNKSPHWPTERFDPLPKELQCTAEHLLAKSEGGRDEPRNIVAACRFCNEARHRCKTPKSPSDHRAHVRKRMAKGRWLAARQGKVWMMLIASR
ncbi:HNH endonuclease [Dinoroseobacter sp. S76]|uniref:HNH endonuclease n=1 Tax=Dinoroseobacter sp. S76 TaxID=3415124 RepID=UPI003C7BC2F9